MRQAYGEPMPKPDDLIAAVHASHARLHDLLRGLDDATIARTSRLPGWTIGHVITHLARNADSVTRRLRAAERGELVPQYDGGAAGRAGEIDAGAGRRAGEMLADLLESDAAVETAFADVPVAVWDRTVLDSSGLEIPATRLPFARWREVEVHLVDLGLGYRAEDWPQPLVERWLPELLEQLPTRTDAQALMAWALGRGPAPELEPWG
jgi:maleylpyruvate isomerase